MIVGAIRAAVTDSDPQARILAAAERIFAQRGFHVATMQDVAAAAGMSPGNLYRYFPSKDAIVAGLCARDQAELAADFGTLAVSEDILAAVAQLLRKHLVHEPRECFQLIVEIWAECARNPQIAEIGRSLDAELRRGLKAVVAGAKRQGVAAADVDEDFAARAILTIGAGLFKRRALEPDFDGEAEVALALGLIGAVFSGAVRPFAGKGGESER
ncbi:MAG TPA: TetR/AcrR family transcriptional regulator [Xanthobacteraceae bacterium]|nr:TetR/AcrR family transcriptional regulator [Xanthobacteraceae bacterium]